MNVEQMATGLVKKQGIEKASSIAKDMAAVNGTDKETTKTQNFWKSVSSRLGKLTIERAAKKAAND